jgi:hypothetical protein
VVCSGPPHRGGHAAIHALGGGVSSHPFHAGVVGEMVVRFQERAEWCSRIKASGSRVCDLVLGPVDGRAHPVARLEEAVGQLW